MASINKPVLSEVEVITGKVTSKTTEKDGNVSTETSQSSSTPVVRAYVDPSDVFNELPVTTMEQLTDLAKQRFASEIVAGHNTDSDIAGFRTTVVRELVKQQHKQLVARVSDKMERKAREFYKELRARGVEREAAIKMSGYKPED
jgi:hypothetical protein